MYSILHAFSLIVVIRAVETMLDRYDRRISDRYKMIDYQEQDNQKEIIVLSNYFLNTTVPTIMGKKYLGVYLKKIIYSIKKDEIKLTVAIVLSSHKLQKYILFRFDVCHISLLLLHTKNQPNLQPLSWRFRIVALKNFKKNMYNICRSKIRK